MQLSRLEVSQLKLDRTFKEDLQFLEAFDATQLFDRGWLIQQYADAIASGIIPFDESKFIYKWKGMLQKLEDCETVLRNITNVSFYRKKSKYMQRFFSYLVRSTDSTRFVFEARKALIERAYLALYRMRLRDFRYGVPIPTEKSRLHDVLAFLEGIDASDELKQLLQTSNACLPTTIGFSSFLGIPIPQKDSKPRAEESKENAPEPVSIEQQDLESQSQPLMEIDHLSQELSPRMTHGYVEDEEDFDSELSDPARESFVRHLVQSADAERSVGQRIFAFIEDAQHQDIDEEEEDAESEEAEHSEGDVPVIEPLPNVQVEPPVILRHGQWARGGLRRDVVNYEELFHNEYHRRWKTDKSNFTPHELHQIEKVQQRTLIAYIDMLCKVLKLAFRTNASGDVRFLQLLQQSLFFEIACTESLEEITSDCLVEFVKRMVKECTQATDSNLRKCKACTFVFPYFILMLKIASSDPHMEFIAHQSMKPLLQLGINFDKYVANARTRYRKDLKYPPAEVALPGNNHIVVETLHDYMTKTEQESVVTFEGATHLILQFDPKCHTERGLDVLHIYGGNETPLIKDGLHGPSKHWPKHPIVVSGNKAVLRFKAESSNSSWGYRCTVVAINLYGMRDPLHDMNHELCSCLGSYLRIVATGSAVTPEEQTCLHWLSSPLFCNGFTRELLSEPLQRLIDGIQDSNELQLHSKMLKSLPFHGSDMLGGKLVDHTVRLVITATIKHLGLEPVLERLCGEEQLSVKTRGTLEEAIKDVWVMAKRFRQWIVSERQKNQLDLEELTSQAKSQGEEDIEMFPDSTLAVAQRRSSYAGICEEIQEKANFLLSANTATASNVLGQSRSMSTESLNSAIHLSEHSSLVRSDSSEARAQTLQQWKAVFRTWKHLQKWMLLRKQRTSKATVQTTEIEPLPTTLVSFLQTSIPLERFTFMIEKQNDRARSRIEALEGLICMLTQFQVERSRLAVLQRFSNPFRQYDPSFGWPHVGHYTRYIESCSPDLAKGVRNCFEQLFQFSYDIAYDEDASTLARMQCMNLLCSEFAPSDHRLLLRSGFLDTIHDNFVIAEEPCIPPFGLSPIDAMYKMQVLLYTFHSNLVIGLGRFDIIDESSTTDTSTPSALDSTQRFFLDSAVIDVRKSLERYLHAKVEYLRSNVEDYIVPRDAAFSVETSCFKYVSLLTHLCCSVECVRYLASVDNICILVLLLVHGSYGLQKRAMILLERFLPHVGPAELQSSGLTMFSALLPASLKGIEQSNDIIQVLFALCGASNTLFDTKPDPNDKRNKKDYRNGEVMRDFGLDLIDLLRQVMATDSWRHVVEARVTTSLAHLTNILRKPLQSSPDWSQRSIVYDLMTSLLLVGGDAMRFREGIRVQSRSKTSAELGTLVFMSRRDNYLRVLFDSNDSKVVQCNMEKLSPVMDLPRFDQQEKIIRHLFEAVEDAQLLSLKQDNARWCLLSRQVRSRLLKAIGRLLSKPEIVGTLIESNAELFRGMCRFAVQCTDLDDFMSLEGIEDVESRLLELIWNSQRGIDKDFASDVVRSQQEILEHSPFRGEKFHLPFCLDVGSCMHMRFNDIDCTSVSFTESPPAVGSVRANHLIPNAVPVYYFEVTLLSEGQGGDWSVAMGLFREGFALCNQPGLNGYAFSAAHGSVHSNDGIASFAKPWSIHDTIGCGFDIQNNAVFFTMNGQHIGTPFSNVNGRFYPILWAESSHCEITVNFGQHPFVYDFAQHLPKRFLKAAESASTDTSHRMNETDIARQTEALTLNALYPDFPLELCVIALENSNDNLMVAANWLIERGWQELERMVNDTIQRSAMEADDDFIPPELKVDDTMASMDEKEDDSWIQLLSSSQSGLQHESLLDDEVDADVPVGIEENEIVRGNPAANANAPVRPSLQESDSSKLTKVEDVSVSSVSIDNVRKGQLLCVAPFVENVAPNSWEPFWSTMSGRLGTVRHIDFNNHRVFLDIFIPNVTTLFTIPFHVSTLQKPRAGLWKDPCADLLTSQFDELVQQHARYESASTILKIRTSVLAAVQIWPTAIPFSTQSLSDIDTSLRLLKLAAAQYLTTGSTENKMLQTDETEGTPLEALRDRFKLILECESSKKLLKPLRPHHSHLANSMNWNQYREYKEKNSLSQYLCEEFLLHVLLSVEYPQPLDLVESRHPYESHQDIRERIHIKGASKLLVTFDPQCRLSSDIMTRLSFYADEKMEDLVFSVQGGRNNQQFSSFIVPSSEFWYKFTSSGDNDYWGYKFTVKPISLRWNDADAIQGMNFEFACWLFDFLLTSLPLNMQKEYCVPLFDTLSWYVLQSKSSMKHRGVELLIRVLLQCQQVGPKVPPNFATLEELRKKIDHAIDVHGDDVTLNSPLVQSVVELLANATIAQDALSDEPSLKVTATPRSSKAVQKFRHSKDRVNWRGMGQLQLRVVSAKYGNIDSNDDALVRDVTESIQALSNQHHAYLIPIPKDLSKLDILVPDVDDILMNELPNSMKKLEVVYEVVTKAYSPTTGGLSEHVLKTSRRLFSHESFDFNQAEAGSYHMIRASLSTFDRIEEISSLITRIQQGSRLPRSFTAQTLKVAKLLQSEAYIISKEVPFDDPSVGLTMSDPYGNDIQANVFALSCWVKLSLPGNGVDKESTVFSKGAIGSSTIRLSVLPNEHRFTLSCSSIDGVSYTISAPSDFGNNKWTNHYVVCQKRYIVWFIGGTKVGMLNVPYVAYSNTHPFYFGRLPFGAALHEKMTGIIGSVADFRMFTTFSEKQEFIRGFTQNGPTLFRRLNGVTKQELFQFADCFGSQWTETLDQDVVSFITQLEESQNHVQHPRLLESNPYALQCDTKILMLFPGLRNRSFETICQRFLVLRLLNTRIADVLSLIDFTQASVSWSLAHRICQLRHLIFLEVKNQPWNALLHQTRHSGRQAIEINRPRALRARERGDPDGKKSIYGQVYRQLHFIRPDRLRTSDRTWNVRYVGEGGTDAGGLFRDSLSAICDDLQSEHLGLLIPCPNSKGFGDNQEKFVPNPSRTSAINLSMYKFLGKLMGTAIRGRHVLNLDLPSVVWKPLVGQPIDRADLEAIDSLCYDVLEKVSNIASEEVNPDEFTDYFSYTFTTISSDGREVELKEGGAGIDVTWENRDEFVRLVEEYRLNEYKLQVDAIRHGLATIVPMQLLPLFTWQELELMVCGRREIDITYLRANTRYKHGVRPDEPHILLFWDVLESFSHQERQMFLRFVWGQSRLPYHPDDWPDKFKIENAMRNGDDCLPVSHTCFFSLELPKYSSKEIMREKILYACYEGLPIDMDHAVQDVNWDEDS